jgi:hypothetical protein
MPPCSRFTSHTVIAIRLTDHPLFLEAGLHAPSRCASRQRHEGKEWNVSDHQGLCQGELIPCHTWVGARACRTANGPRRKAVLLPVSGMWSDDFQPGGVKPADKEVELRHWYTASSRACRLASVKNSVTRCMVPSSPTSKTASLIALALQTSWPTQTAVSL